MLTKLKKLPITQAITKVCFVLLGYLPADKKLIIFESFLGKQYSCNPKAIYEYMQEHHPEYKMYWSVDPRYIKNFEGTGVQVLRRFSLKWFYLLARAKFWVTNSRMPLWIPKPRHTTYVQTWHGTPLKKLAFDIKEVHMPGVTTEKYKQEFYHESRNWDYLLSPNGYSSEIFRRAFRFEKELLECGYPRNDVLHNGNTEENITTIKKKIGIPLDKKVILYAPTWRDNQFYKVGHYKFDLPLDLEKLQNMYGDKYIILLRMHYLVAENFDLTPYKGFAYDFSNRVDINDLYLVSDILVTDYSSVFFDYANLQRPIVFYTYDIDEYRETLRGFYFDLEEEAPGPLVKDMGSFLEVLEEFDEKGEFQNYQEKYNEFYYKYCYLEDGSSAKKVVHHVFL